MHRAIPSDGAFRLYTKRYWCRRHAYGLDCVPPHTALFSKHGCSEILVMPGLIVSFVAAISTKSCFRIYIPTGKLKKMFDLSEHSPILHMF
jgi:hypothetical protein